MKHALKRRHTLCPERADVRRSLQPREEEIIAVASDLVGIPSVGLSKERDKPVALRFRKNKFRF